MVSFIKLFLDNSTELLEMNEIIHLDNKPLLKENKHEISIKYIFFW